MLDTIATATTSSASVQVGYDLLTPLVNYLLGYFGLLTGITLTTVLGITHIMWGIFVTLSYLASFVFLYLYIYASIHHDKLAELQDEQIKAQEEAFVVARGGVTQSSRLQELRAHIESENPNDWKLSLIEADIIMDELLKQQGYTGTSLGERLRDISPQSLASLNDAWEAHKVRNQIAHAGPDFVLTNKLARETIMRYERVFHELEVL